MEQKPGDPGWGPVRSADHQSGLVLWESWLFRLAIILFVVSRVPCAWLQTIGSDEPQHAHVAWAWTRGLVQYRDVFDNHAPLFHLLSAPLVAIIGERTDILALLRCGIIGLNLVTLFLVWRICRSLFSVRAARWATMGLAFFPPFFLDDSEFRTDVLWTTLWVAWIALVTSRLHLGAKCFWGGVLLAACFGTSLKSVLLLLAAAVAFGVALVMRPRFLSAIRPSVVLKGSGLALAGFSILTGGILCLFGSMGACPAMYRCVIEHNLGGQEPDFLHRVFRGALDPRFWFFVPALYFVAFALGRRSSEQHLRIAFLVLFVGFYPLLLLGGWPVITRQDFLPLYPLLFACLPPLVLSLLQRLPEPRTSRLTSLACLVLTLLVETGWSTQILRRKASSDPIEADRIGEVLRLTKPDETVLDPKGEVVLRRRPIYDVLELFTMEQYRDDLLPDRIPEQLIANRTMVAVSSDRYPGRTRRFLQENYLSCGRLLIAGMEAHENAGGVFRFQLALGGSYVFLSKGHLISGKLNGVLIPGKTEMQPGSFEFVPDSKDDWPLTIQWERAYELGAIGVSGANRP
jgi:Dolichyl-phosphate-mannose-protein mannosyltransferase